MVLYLSVIFFSMMIVSILNILFCLPQLNVPWWTVFACVSIVVAFQFAVDGICAIIVKVSPESWYNKNKKIFQVSASEIRFLNFLKVKKWKDFVWELGGLGGFRKNKIQEPQNQDYVERFLMESNKGVATHLFGIFAGFAAIWVFPFRFALTVCLPIALVNMVLNIMPIMVLRYNIPKLLALQKFLEKREQREQNVLV